MNRRQSKLDCQVARPTSIALFFRTFSIVAIKSLASSEPFTSSTLQSFFFRIFFESLHACIVNLRNLCRHLLSPSRRGQHIGFN